MTDKKMRQDRVPQEQEPKRVEADSRPVAGDAAAPVNEAEDAQARAPSSPAFEQVSDLQDRYLRLAADFENFRKRAARERAELFTKAQADLVARLVDALDDLARFAKIDPGETDSRTMHQGVDMVERKLWKQLNGVGVERIDATEVPFNPAIHEAVTTSPAPTPERDRTVGTVLQPGYRLGALLIRPARVVVQLWSDQEPPAS